MNGREFRRLLLPLLAFGTILMLLPPLLLSGLTRATGMDSAVQAHDRQAAILATGLAEELQLALDAGVPPEALPDVAGRFARMMQRFPDFLFLALLDRQGGLLQSAGMPPEKLQPLLQAGRQTLPDGLHAARGRPVPVATTTGEIVVTRYFLGRSSGPGAELVYAVRPYAPPEFFAREFAMLGAMSAVLLLLGLPALHAAARHNIRLPMAALRQAFEGASAGRFEFAGGGGGGLETDSVARLWNNEVLSLQERRSQVAAFAAEALAAADDPAVARELERIAAHPDLASSAAQAEEQTAARARLQAARDRGRLRLPLLFLAFLAGICLGNVPSQLPALCAAAGLLAGLALGLLGAGRGDAAAMPVALLRPAALACMAAFPVLLAAALRPEPLSAGLLEMAQAAASALPLGVVLAAPLAWRTAGAALTRRERVLLLLHLAAGLLAAAIWSLAGPASAGDTLEPWLGLAILPLAAALLWRREA